MTSLLNKHVTVDGVRIAHRDSGGLGRAVVLIHGTPSHSHIWRNVVPGLENGGYRVLAFDLLGYGESERPLNRDTSVAAQARILEQLVDTWGIDQADVVGHDIGGATAMIFAVRNPERLRTLTLIDTVSYDSWPSQTWQAIIRENLREYQHMPLNEFRDMMTRQLMMTVYDKSRMTAETLDAYLAPLSGELGKTSFFIHQASHYDSHYTEEIVEDLRSLTIPTKILWGADDEWQPTTYAQALAKDIPSAELTVIPEAGHFLTEDAPDRVVAEITNFVV